MAKGGRLMFQSSNCEQDASLLCLFALGQGSMGKHEVDNAFSRKAEKQRRLSTWKERSQGILNGGTDWKKWGGCQWPKEPAKRSTMKKGGRCEVG